MGERTWKVGDHVVFEDIWDSKMRAGIIGEIGYGNALIFSEPYDVKTEQIKCSISDTAAPDYFFGEGENDE